MQLPSYAPGIRTDPDLRFSHGERENPPKLSQSIPGRCLYVETKRNAGGDMARHNRKVLNFSFGIGRKAQKWDQCDENLKSFAHMAVASLVGCSFCLDLGYFQAHNEG